MMEKIEKNEPIATRRKFLKKVWTALGVLAAVEFGILTFGFLLTGKKSGQHSKGITWMAVGAVSDFDTNTVYPFRNGMFYLVRLKDGGFLALSLKCTHLGCSVVWDENKSQFHCPCHASSFDMYGNVVDPPAPRALDMYPVVIERGQLQVDISSPMKRNDFKNEQLVYA
jgi:cytochrome b6-f complex iron-sulfur subunit